MKLIEEKKLLIFQVVSSILLLISTVFVQIADFNIAKYNEGFVKRALILLNKHQIRDDYNRTANFYTIFQAIPDLHYEIKEDLLNSKGADYVDPEEMELINKLQEGEISTKDFLQKSKVNKKRRSFELLSEFNKGATKLNEYMQRGTVWLFIRNFVLIPLQIIFILILIIGYYLLFIQISNRINKTA